MDAHRPKKDARPTGVCGHRYYIDEKIIPRWNKMEFEKKQEMDIEVYEAYKTLKKHKKLSVEEEQEMFKIRESTIIDKLNYLSEQKHLKDCKVIVEKIHNYPVIRIERKDGTYDYSFVLEKEIFEDKKWIGHCSSCLKPLFKGDEGSEFDKKGSQYGLSWRGCKECSERNGYKISIFSGDSK